MKALLDCQGTPFLLAHGGVDIQLNSTCQGLLNAGVEADYLRWWDRNQECDLIHTYSVPDSQFLKFARQKKVPIICTSLFTANCNRSNRSLKAKGLLVSSVLASRRIPVVSLLREFSRWESFRQFDCNIVGLEAEADVLKLVYGVPAENIRIVPLGLSEIFLDAPPSTREEDHLITTGTITERKRSVEIAEMAHTAKVPVLFVGKPYSEDNPYWKKFQGLVDGKYVKHIPHTDHPAELVELMRKSRGYILNSYYENWCLSAHEAIACGLPILVPDQRWSRECFGDQATYLKTSREEVLAQLKEFHAAAASLPAPDIKLHSWNEVGLILKDIYSSVLAKAA